MARPRKPLSLQKGNLTQEQKFEKELQDDLAKGSTSQLEKPPKWLKDSVAKKEWLRLVEEYKTLSIISNLDLNNLGIYCNAYSSYLEVSKKLNKEDYIVEHTNKAGATNCIENPLLKIQKYYSEEIKKYSSLLGLTIDSRLKIAAIKSTETKSEIVEEFGDI